MNKKGLSPVIATVLLVALVLVLASVIYLWARAVIPEAIEKSGEIIENKCKEVVFDASYSAVDSILTVQNNGNVPIYGVRYGVGSFGSLDYVEIQPWLLTAGVSQSKKVDFSLPQSGDEMSIIPIILGKSDNELKAFACEENGIVIEVQ